MGKRFAYQRFCLIFIVAAVSSLVVEKPATASPLRRVVISYAAADSPILPLWMSKEKNYFQKYGIDPQLVQVRGAPVNIAALSSGDAQFVCTNGSVALSAAAAGLDVVILATLMNNLNYDFVASPVIKKAADLKGKTVGVQSIGGGVWIGTMLALEHLGLDPQRDGIKILVVGDMLVLAQALETGKIDASVLIRTFSRPLRAKGFSLLADLYKDKIPVMRYALMSRRSFVRANPQLAEDVLKAVIEGIAYIWNPANKQETAKILFKQLRLANFSDAEEAREEVVPTIDRKAHPIPEGLRNIQRLLAPRNPKVGALNADALIDGTFIRALDRSGFLDEIYR